MQPLRRRALSWVLGWLLAAALAVTVGVVAVTSLGDSLRDRGPIGDNELIRQAELSTAAPSVDAGASAVRRTFEEEFGSFTVECRGAYAVGVSADPDTASGWRVISFEAGLDDDVDAVFATADRSIEIEVFCNRGEPTVSDYEEHERPAGDGD